MNVSLSRLPRARGEIRLAFARAGARSEAARIYESGGWRVRFPRSGALCEAVVVNTGGGMAGGDHVELAFAAGPNAAALVTSQSQEKIYRAAGAACQMRTRLEVGEGARLIFAPQETLLFEGARLERRLEADVAPTATLTLIEAVAFGRLAHGETCIDATLADNWRIRRDGRLVFAEAMRIDDAGATLDRAAIGAGARAWATLIRVGPDAADKLDPLREALSQIESAPGPRLEAAASVVDGVLTARALSASPQRLRAALIAAWRALEGQDAPRVWY